MLNSRISFQSQVFGARDFFQEVLTCPLGFWRGVKLSPQKTRREERTVRKMKQGRRPWVERRKGLTKLDFEEKIAFSIALLALSSLCYVGHLRRIVNTELPAVTTPFTIPSRRWNNHFTALLGRVHN